MAAAAPTHHKHQDALDRALEVSDAEAIAIYRGIVNSPFEADEDSRGKEIAITRLAELLAKKRWVIDSSSQYVRALHRRSVSPATRRHSQRCSAKQGPSSV